MVLCSANATAFSDENLRNENYTKQANADTITISTHPLDPLTDSKVVKQIKVNFKGD
jgi:hypothetical protein